MYEFSSTSKAKLTTCDNKLQLICKELIKEHDFSIICGFRDEIKQIKAYESGKSFAKWGESKHNSKPSKAVDIIPYPCNWEDTKSFQILGEAFLKVAKGLNIDVTWGAHFKNIKDYPHFELS